MTKDHEGTGSKIRVSLASLGDKQPQVPAAGRHGDPCIAPQNPSPPALEEGVQGMAMWYKRVKNSRVLSFMVLTLSSSGKQGHPEYL
jgi:hypothetical protein